MKLEIQNIDGVRTVRVGRVFFTFFPTHGDFWEIHSVTDDHGNSLDFERHLEWLRENLPEEVFDLEGDLFDIEYLTDLCGLNQ